MGMQNSTYDDLISEAGNELHWFCEPCYSVVKNPLNDDKVIQVLQQLTRQLAIIEEKLDTKVDSAKVDALEKNGHGAGD